MHTLLCILGALAADEVSFSNHEVKIRASPGWEDRYLTAYAQTWCHAMMVSSAW